MSKQSFGECGPKRELGTEGSRGIVPGLPLRGAPRPPDRAAFDLETFDLERTRLADFFGAGPVVDVDGGGDVFDRQAD